MNVYKIYNHRYSIYSNSYAKFLSTHSWKNKKNKYKYKMIWKIITRKQEKEMQYHV